ncbi:MAG: MerR family transcriptional regulator [Myxococcota bacterium]
MKHPKGRYRINAVAEMTGIPAATLRAWERRYGLPEPRRTESSYRVYTDGDVALIRRVRELCDEGLAPSEAAKVVLAEAATPPPATSDADPYTHSVAEIVDAVEAFAPMRLERAVTNTLALGPATTVFDRVLAPALVEIGQRWHDGKFTIAQEHMATQVIGSTAVTLLRLVQPEHSDRVAVLACFADEEHAIPPIGFGLHLASWGIRAVRLGARTPPSALGHAVAELTPTLVALSTTVAPAPHRARELIEEYGAACRATPWVVGGPAAESMAPRTANAGGTTLIDREPRALKVAVESLIAGARRKA